LLIANELVQAFNNEIEKASLIMIGTHLNPDGDALGSALGLALYLEQRGKEVEVLCNNEPPRNMKYLPTVKRVRQTPKHNDHDLAIIVDLDSLERLGKVEKYFYEPGRMIVIDHHIPHQAPGDLRIVDTKASATALILAQLFTQLNAEFTPQIATCLYTGIVTDTGSFRFRNTTSDTLAAAALLLEKGADLERVSEEVFQSKQLSSMRLLGHALETMKLDSDNQLAWAALSYRDFEWANAADEDTEGFVNELLSIDTVQIAALLREPKPGKVRCSLRSRGSYDIAAVAREFGGGGHKNAAGCTFDTDLVEAEHLLIEVMRKCLASA
jgi:bifunctional oligoribonuclease and PAP phosphatase NrnA